MGKSAPSERLPRGVSGTNTNYELRITNFRRCIFGAVFLAAFRIFGLDVFAQTDFENFARIVERGSVEQKRNVLIQIRNPQDAEAARGAVPLLKDSSEIVRATAAASVIFLPKNEAAQNLLPLLKDKSPLVRREAAFALGKTQNPSAINFLIQTARRDKIYEVKSACAAALGEIGDASAVDFLTTILQKKLLKKEEFLRRSAARSIGQIAQIIQTGEPTVVTPAAIFTEPIVRPVLPKYPSLVKSFSQFAAANQALIQTLRNQTEFPDVKREAAFALGAIGDESAIAVLQNLANAEDYFLAEIARQSLQKISARSNQTPK